MRSSDTHAAIAAHRFGLGESSLNAIGGDAPGWLLQQLGPAPPQTGVGLVSGAEGIRRFAQFIASQRRNPAAIGSAQTGASMGASTGASMGAGIGGTAASDTRSTEQQFGEHFRAIVQADLRARLSTAALSTRPFTERLALFWANHFTVSMAKASARGLVGAFEREAIRPNMAGNFEQLLKAAVQHAGMLRYLDNDHSAGPDSAIVLRLARRQRADAQAPPRLTGLNENLAREILELHTVGATGGYSQADVTAFAQVLTGWRVPLQRLLAQPADAQGVQPVQFDAAWHQPGDKVVLGRRYAEGPQALDQVLHDLAAHPATARFVSTKLVRHLVADDPPPALVARLEASFLATGGDLPSLYRSLVQSPEAWAPQQAKLKTPEEFVISTVRVLNLGEQAFARQADGAVNQMGQRVQAAPSPAGWPDRAEEWLGPDAVWKRLEWATRVAGLVGRQADARALARASLGPLLQDDTLRQIERAADGPQALTLMLMAPEFQRR